MKRLLKTASSLLALFTTISAIAACADQSTVSSEVTSAETTEAATTETEKILPDLPESDFEGYEFRVLTKGDFDVHWKTKDIFAEELNADPINDAVFNRNSSIGEKYNFKVVEIESFSDYAGAGQKSVIAGSDDYDMFAIGLGTLGTYSTNGYVIDLKTVPYMDLEKPWYDQNANSSLSIEHKLFATTGDLMIMDNDATWVLLFNKQLANELQLGDLYQAVKDGTWTLDKLYQCVQNASSDLNGDGKLDETDQWGIEGESFNTFALCAGSGNRVVSKDSDDMPYLSINTPDFIAAFEKAITINSRTGSICFYVSNYTSKFTDVWTDCMDKIFSDGRSLFNFAGMNRVTLFRSMDTDFGILPVPKFNEAQTDYHCAVSCWCASSIMIPKTVTNLDRTGIIIEALSAESYYTLTPAYYDISLKTKYSRDEQSSEMLDLIFASRIYDLGNIFDWGGVFSLPGTLTENSKSDFASAYAKLEKAATKAMDKTIEAYSKNT